MEIASRKRGREYISNEKSRVTTFKYRKSNMMKKIHELSVLCGVDACLVVYGPDQNGPEIWPPNPQAFKSILNRYEALGKKPTNDMAEPMRSLLLDSKNSEQELLTNEMTAEQMNVLEKKIKVVSSRIEMLRGRENELDEDFSSLLESLLQRNIGDFQDIFTDDFPDQSNSIEWDILDSTNSEQEILSDEMQHMLPMQSIEPMQLMQQPSLPILPCCPHCHAANAAYICIPSFGDSSLKSSF